jgi:hypothetical protein
MLNRGVATLDSNDSVAWQYISRTFEEVLHHLIYEMDF